MLINIKNVLDNDSIKNRDEALHLIASKINGVNQEELFNNFVERENQVSTGFENGIAIPHAKISGIETPQIVVLRSNGINWPSMDGKETNLIIAIVVPIDGSDDHLKILGELTRRLIDNNFIQNLKTNEPSVVCDLINDIKLNDKKQEVVQSDKYYVGVTKCPVGIAHTYMAAEALDKAAKELGFSIKVETQGSVGIENKLTQEDIKNASGVIIAADVAIDQKHRFNNKKVIEVPIKRTLNDVNTLFEEVDNANVVTNLDSGEKTEDVEDSLIKHVMNGVSHMIPFVVVGGILIALSLSIGGEPTPDGLVIPEGSIWNSFLNIGSFGFTLMIPILAGYIAYSMAGRAALAPAMIGAMVANDPATLGTEAGTGFLGALLVGIMAGYIVRYLQSLNVKKELKPIMPIFVIPIIGSILISAVFIVFLGKPIEFLMNQLVELLTYLSSSPYLSIPLGMAIGSMIALDMGGPINKTAFLFGLAMIPTNPEIMGAVAAAIAVPPLSMGVATLIKKSKFTQEEQSMGIAALLMGFIGITEGAIPFAASDPKRVIPSIVVGSMVASVLSLQFGVTNMVPHGGPIVGVLGAINLVIPYFICILAGTLAAAFMVVAIKQDK